MSEVLDLALRLWPAVRDHGSVDDPAALDALLDAQGRPGAPGYDGGVRGTFAAFAPDETAEFALPTGEQPAGDEEARFVAHLVVTRTLLGAGLHVDQRVVAAMSDAYALTWTAKGGEYRQSPLALATSLWLVALDPLSASDRPLPIDWSPPAYQDGTRWELDYRLFSHYDIRERALDWALYASVDPVRHPGVSVWTVAEPLLRMQADSRAQVALAQLSESAEATTERAPAAAMIERSRIARLLQDFVEREVRGTAPRDGGARPEF